MRSAASITTVPISRSSPGPAEGSASATSASVRITVSGLRSSWLALATKRSCASNARAIGASWRPANSQPTPPASSAAPSSASPYWKASWFSATVASACGSVRPRWRPTSQ